MSDFTQEEQDKQWMDIALQLADQAAELQEVPVGCIIIRDKKIIGVGHNRRETWADPTAHAEMIAIRDAAKQIGQWRLMNTTVYCTMEPCPMCAGALINARIERLVFGCSDPKAGCCGSLHHLHKDGRFNHQFIVVSGIRKEEAAGKLRSFFKERRRIKAEQKKQSRRDGRAAEGA